ncbi:REP-associated tyrosine transposase [Candidatus Venteria ishoeyi]|uniref:Transposase IS200 like protein n=1 Tax=Candidatus Venteria ishoeyi TaxID=1899563 RepID=A0A1H6F6Q6_9GAMM|nr:transposase [Candidatus Venteria ishoeyi]SEH05828.1 Transposase IS200 like protein [Candidatus Venteria ishoeyi]
MPNYRRWRVSGGCYFFTVNLLERKRHLLVEHIDLLREAFRIVKQKRPFHIDAIVILPEHLHCIWVLPENDNDYSGRWRAIKKHFSKNIPATEHRSANRIKRHERAIWQRRFWEHTIRNDRDYASHVDYIHYNPVKHGWVEHPRDWPFSTYHRYMNNGMYPAYWGQAAPKFIGEFGES